MAYLNLMILVSRYIFTGFALLFGVIVLGSIKSITNGSLQGLKGKNSLLFSIILFFHIGASSILFAKAQTQEIRIDLLKNSGMLLLILVFFTFFYGLRKKQTELFLMQIVLFLVDVGYIMLQRLEGPLANKHVIWAIIGSVAVVSIQFIGKKLLKQSFQYVYIGLFMASIFLPFVFGFTANGAMNWVEIAGFSFQPSEIGKVLLVLTLSAIFSKQSGVNKKEVFIGASIVAMSLAFLALQTDLGGAFLYYLTFLWMLLIAKQSVVFPLIGASAGMFAAFIGYHLFSHVRVRVHNWLDPWQDVSGNGYQVVQGLFAMGTWGWFGSGLTRGIPHRIPYVTTDYIFAAICEEFGNLFAIIIIAIYMGMILLIFQVAIRQKNRFYKMITVGTGIILGLQTLMIVGGVLKVIPLTGVTLPFISYGGSSLLTSFIMIGVVLCLMEEKEEKKKEMVKSEKRK